jgi:hypothetical protein
MNHEFAEAANAELRRLRQIRYSILQGEGLREVARGAQERIAALEETLIGDEPLIRDAVAHLTSLTDRALEDPDLSREFWGNEIWVCMDVVHTRVPPGPGRVANGFAIFRNTGCLYRVESDGAVEDDPIYVPKGSPYGEG